MCGGNTWMWPESEHDIWLKQRLAQGALTIGAWLTVPSSEVAEAMASLGFDWLVVDMEHGLTDVAEAARAFVAAERHRCAPLARLPSADPFLARRLLDAGAHGLLIPAVENPDSFAAFARHCFYPPSGRRGAALGRFNRWGDDFDDYFTEFSPVLVPMIETRAGIENANEIAALPMVDGLFFGPYDLSAGLGTPGDLDTEEMQRSLVALKTACEAHGKAPGGHQVKPDPAALQRLIDEGFRFIAFGTDIAAMRHALSHYKEVAKQK